MQYASWERSRQKKIGYARRCPQETVLYRILYHYREKFEFEWEATFQPKYGVLRDVVLDAFDKYLDCGLLLHGCARARCENCNHSELIAFSCKRRGLCPSCNTKRSLIFAEHLHEHVLLPHPHRHLVFTIPKRLRVYFKFNRELTKHLYHAAWESWQEIVSRISAQHENRSGDGTAHSRGIAQLSSPYSYHCA